MREVSQLPIVALMTFDEGAETLAGVGAREAADRLAELDLAAFGANHGAGLLAALEALEQMRGDGRVLAALPNIGLASLSGGRVIYPHATPDYFAEFAAHARDLGARADRRLLRHDADGDRRDQRGARREPPGALARSSCTSASSSPRWERSSARPSSSRALREGEFVVSVQLDPPLGGSSRGPARDRRARWRTRAASASST